MNGKNKPGLERKEKINLGLKFFFFFWLGHELGPSPKRGPRDPWGPAGAGPGPGKKPGSLNGSGSGYGSCPASRVRVWKNPARTRPVVIPNLIINQHLDPLVINSLHFFDFSCTILPRVLKEVTKKGSFYGSIFLVSNYIWVSCCVTP